MGQIKDKQPLSVGLLAGQTNAQPSRGSGDLGVVRVDKHLVGGDIEESVALGIGLTHVLNVTMGRITGSPKVKVFQEVGSIPVVYELVLLGEALGREDHTQSGKHDGLVHEGRSK